MEPDVCTDPIAVVVPRYDGLFVEHRPEGVRHAVLGHQGVVLLVPQVEERVEVGGYQVETKSSQREREQSPTLPLPLVEQGRHGHQDDESGKPNLYFRSDGQSSLFEFGCKNKKIVVAIIELWAMRRINYVFLLLQNINDYDRLYPSRPGIFATPRQ